jgi:hypothetical protein
MDHWSVERDPITGARVICLERDGRVFREAIEDRHLASHADPVAWLWGVVERLLQNQHVKTAHVGGQNAA